MATAEAATTFTLTMSREEALAVLAVAGYVAGHPGTTPRGIYEGAMLALSEALGFDYLGYREAAKELGVSMVRTGGVEFGVLDPDA